MGLRVGQVEKIMKQFQESLWKIYRKLDFEHMTVEEYRNLRKKGICFPGLGTFRFNWKIIEAYQNKYNKKEEHDQD